MVDYIRISFLNILVSAITIYIFIGFFYIAKKGNSLKAIISKSIHSVWFIMLITIIAVLSKVFLYVQFHSVTPEQNYLLKLLIFFCFLFTLVLIIIAHWHQLICGQWNDKMFISIILFFPIAQLITENPIFYDFSVGILFLMTICLLILKYRQSERRLNLGYILLIMGTISLVTSNVFRHTLDSNIFEIMSYVFTFLLIHALFFVIVYRFSNELDESYEIVKNKDSEIEISNKQMKEMVYFDQITGLPNRYAFEKDMRNIIKPTYFAMANIQNFLGLNNLLSYERGDKLLHTVGHTIHDYLHEDEHVYRYYADKFIILFSSHNRDEVVHRLSEILSLFNNNNHFSKEINLTLYSGIVDYRNISSNQSENYRNIVASLEIASSRAKETEDKIYLFNDEDGEFFQKEVHFEMYLKNAVQAHDFFVHYQPQVYANTGEIHGYEALARWQSNGQFVSPELFITRAEELGLIYDITRQIVELVFNDIANEPLFANKRISINLSGANLVEDSFLNFLKEMISKYQIEPAQIVFEITESILFNDVQRVMDNLLSIKALGFELSLDDFGDGYSSFYRFAKLPIDEVKFDKSFVTDITEDLKMQDTLLFMSRLFKSYKMRIVLEGVETEEQLMILNKMNIDIYQGYHFYKPMSLDTIKALP